MVNKFGHALIGAVLLAAVIFASYVAWIWVALLLCGGDGGAPYAADLSPRGQACDAMGTVMPIAALVAVAVTAAGAVLATRRHRLRLAVFAAVAGLGLAWSPVAVLSALDPSCSNGDTMSGGCERY